MNTVYRKLVYEYRNVSVFCLQGKNPFVNRVL